MTKEEAKSLIKGMNLLDRYTIYLNDIIDSIDSPITTKPEPSRLEIAAMLCSGMLCSKSAWEYGIVTKEMTERAYGLADALIEQSKK